MENRIITDITNYIFVSDSPQESDVIFLPGSSDPTIPEKAAELYADGLAKYVIPSGGVSVKTGKFNGVQQKADIYNGDYQTEYDFYTDVLVKNNVPLSAIIEESKSGYTKQNATFSRVAADNRGLAVRTAIVVCKSFHARRCLMCYQFAFPQADIRIVPVDVYDVTRDNWHTHAYGIDRVLGELSRCGNQFVEEMKEFAI